MTDPRQDPDWLAELRALAEIPADHVLQVMLDYGVLGQKTRQEDGTMSQWTCGYIAHTWPPADTGTLKVVSTDEILVRGAAVKVVRWDSK